MTGRAVTEITRYMYNHSSYSYSTRSAAEFNTKPVTSVLWLGTAKILFFPFAWEWWREKHVTFPMFVLGSILYFLQAILSLLVLMHKLPLRCEEGIPNEAQVTTDLRTEMIIPLFLWIIVAIQYGHLVAASQPERKMGYSRSARLQNVVLSHKRLHHDSVSDDASGDDDEEAEPPYSEELQEREEKVECSMA